MCKMKQFIICACLLAGIISCKKNNNEDTTPSPPVVDTATVKGASGFTTGVAISYDLFKNTSAYSTLVKNQFDRVTFEYQMKHQPNVQNNGSFNFTNTDELVNLVRAAGMDIHGHTLVWHQNNNATYLRSLTGTTGPNLVPNPGFENDFVNWFTQVSATAPTSGAISITTTGAQQGSKAARIVVTTPGPNAYSIQIVSDNFAVVSGTSYTLHYWAKASVAGQSLRAVAQGTSYYQQLDQSLTTTWAEYTFPFTPAESAVSIKFHFPNAGDFLVDNLSVQALGSAPDPVLVNTAMQSWITAIVGRYAGKIKSWDVVNEAFDDNGNLRTGTSTNDLFYWGSVLGNAYIENAFTYAHAADPAALLFINDYNLELNNSKLDAFIATANDLKTRGIPIHGVGTQMHISVNTSNANIDAMFQKLAATGLIVHVSELDVRINPSGATPFSPTPDLLTQQAAKYRYVAESYKMHVPAAQRFGITVWNVTDGDTWINGDYPTLFNADYSKKPAWYEFLSGLKN